MSGEAPETPLVCGPGLPRPFAFRESRIGDDTHLLGLFFSIVADPELEGYGVRLVWADEWPDSWR